MQTSILTKALWLSLSASLILQAAVTPANSAGATDVLVNRIPFSAKVERVAPNRGRLSIAAKVEGGAKYRLLDGAGKEVSTTLAGDGVMKADVDPTRGYLLMPHTVEQVPLAKEGIQFPGRYVTFSPNGTTHLGGLFLRPASVPLTWNDERHAYATELVVGYEFQDGHYGDLAVPKVVTFFTDGANARIKEGTVTITKSGGAGYQKVWLSTGQTEGVTSFTARAGLVDELKSSVSVLREIGGIKLSLPSTALPAFGVGSEMLSVELIGKDGAPIASSNVVEVQLTSHSMAVPSTVVVPVGKSSSAVEIRSIGVGADEIVAVSGSMRAVQAVRLILPVAAVIAGVIGGALGGLARYFRTRHGKGQTPGRRVAEGMLVGVIVVGAVWAGLVAIKFNSSVMGTPFGAFVLAALSGYLGCFVLDRVAGSTFQLAGAGK